MKKCKPLMMLLSLCMISGALFTTGCKDDTYEPWVNPVIDPDKINWEECLSVRVDGNEVEPESQNMTAGVYLGIAVVGAEPIKATGWKCTLRIVNYGKQKIPFTNAWISDLKQYETTQIPSERWNNGLGYNDKTPNAKYIWEILPAQEGTYEFAIELIQDFETQTSPHYCSPRYKLTMAQDENKQWSLTFGKVE